MHQNRLKNNSAAFTLVEVVIVVAVLSFCAMSCKHLYAVYQTSMLRSATHQLSALYTYLGHCAAAANTVTSCVITGDTTYCVNDGNLTTQCRLPAGVVWGAPRGTYGPPSRPEKLIELAVVGGRSVPGGSCLMWDAGGAATPSTSYISAGPYCAALSMSRAIVGNVQAWVLQNGRWIKCWE